MSNTTKKIRKSNFVKEYKERNISTNLTEEAEKEWKSLKNDCQKGIRDYLDKIKKNNAIKEVNDYKKSELLAKALENENNSGNKNNSENEYNSENFESVASNDDKPLIERYNNFIGEEYKDSFLEEDKATKPVGKLSRAFKLPARHQAFNWMRMNSDGNGNDCLIHSILTATCPNFRKLKLDAKREIAHSFRTEIYPKLPTAEIMLEDQEEGDDDYDRIFGEEFLNDTDLRTLASDLGIDFLMFETAKTGKVVGQGKVTMPQTVTYFGDNNSEIVYLLFNYKNIHFESIKTDKGSYSISMDQAKELEQEFRADPSVSLNCIYNLRDRVLYNEEEYTVTDRHFTDDQECDELELDNHIKVLKEDFGKLKKVPKAKGGSRKHRRGIPKHRRRTLKK